MTTAVETLSRPEQPSEAARQRMLSVPGEPMFIAGWQRVAMIHFEVEADRLQRVVPFELELWEGRAFVTLVAFTMEGMRSARGGRFGAWLFRPVATHEFLNVRTYVRCGAERGIHFLAEWLPNRLAVLLGPPVFGLPYRHGRIDYEHDPKSVRWCGSVIDKRSRRALRYGCHCEAGQPFGPCERGSLDEWLMERYTAFNSAGGRRRFFRVWHEPWPQVPAEPEVSERSLLVHHWPFFADARLCGANVSPGVAGVWMGRPHRCRQRNSISTASRGR